MKTIAIRTALDSTEDWPRQHFSEPSRTKQEFLTECDINTIISRYAPQELAAQAGGREPIYGDFSDPEITDYAASLRRVMGINDLMARLPAKVRARFQNDPQSVLAFVQDARNRQEAIDLGLIPRPPPEPNTSVPEAHTKEGTKPGSTSPA